MLHLRPVSRDLVLAGCFAFALPFSAFAHGYTDDEHDHDHKDSMKAAAAHVHGLGEVSIAQDGAVLTVILDSAAYNVAGFERVATSEADLATVAMVRERLNKASTLFGFGGPKGCALTASEINTSVFDAKKVESAAEQEHDHDYSGEAHEHGNISAEYIFTCSKVAPLKSVTFGVFAAFPKFENLKVAFLGDTQAAATATAEKPRVTF
jgi:hypothetical protein